LGISNPSCTVLFTVTPDGPTGRLELMKNDKTSQKLRLHKETLKNLSEESLTQAAGGNGNSAGVICLYSIVLCGDSVICSILATSCGNG
jgi:hypothetical protein